MNNQMITSDEKSVALEFVSKVRGYLSDVSRSFFKIGYELSKAQESKHFKALGYDSLEDLAEDVFGFSKTTTYDMLKVYNGCKKMFAPSYMREEFEPYSFSQLAAMQTGRFAGASVMISRIKPTDSVRAIKKYVAFWNKYTDKHSGYPNVTLQGWLAQEQKRQEQVESSEQLQLGELVEEETPDETPGEIFRTSELQEVAEEAEIEEQEEIEEETPDEEQDETENVSRETEIETQRYTFENRAQARAFMADYENWASRTGLWWLDTRCYQFENGATVYAVWSMVLQDVESRKTGRVVHYYLSQNGIPAEVTKDQLEKYIAAHADEL